MLTLSIQLNVANLRVNQRETPPHTSPPRQNNEDTIEPSLAPRILITRLSQFCTPRRIRTRFGSAKWPKWGRRPILPT